MNDTLPENCPSCQSPAPNIELIRNLPGGGLRCDDPWHEQSEPAYRPPGWSLAAQSQHERIGARRRRDLVIHLKAMQLRLGFEKGLPYAVLKEQADELGELIEQYNDTEVRDAQTDSAVPAGDRNGSNDRGDQPAPAQRSGCRAP